ncbi:MAG: rhodanese-like domain-containing protein [Leptospiraceae bacterium]|nr:rhodanese-like domain-containing protein [Leptospiraceae bacterium]MCP5499741.1 rhodanese-like domain-containing protein [Leptospiraceae bacterium]
MKRILLAVNLVFLIIACSPPAKTLENSKNFTWVDKASWQKIQAENPKTLMVDVRTEAEWKEGHLEGALFIPMSELQARISEIPKDIPVLIYCRSGNRSTVAANFLASQGYKNLYNLRGGIVVW